MPGLCLVTLDNGPARDEQWIAVCRNETDWSNIIDVTHDFVVAAVDNTGELDFATDIKASIPAPKFRALKKNGLI